MIFLVTNQTVELGFPKRSIKDIYSYFDHSKYNNISVDTETTGLDPHTCRILTIQLGDSTNQFVVDCTTIDIQLLKPLLESHTLVMHNAKFDLKFLYKHRIVPTKVYCTYLAEAVLNKGDKSVRKSLKAVAKRYLDKEMDKGIRGQIIWKGLVPEVIRYAARDVEFLDQIKVKQAIQLYALHLENSMRLENEFVKVLAYIEYCGIYLDKELWMRKVERELEEYKDSETALDKWIMDNQMEKYIDPQLNLFEQGRKCAINWQSSHQVIPLLKDLGVNTVVLDESGKEKNSADSKMLTLQEDKSPFIPLYLKFKKCEKVSTTYGETFIKQINPVTGRVHSNFTQVMDTGRLSSGGSGTINLQNIPADKPTRGCFTRSSDDTTLISCDYPGQEQIIFANWTQDPNLLEFYKSGKGDMHSFVASKVYPDLKNLPLQVIKQDHPVKRQNAKKGGFAMNYGGNGSTVARNLGLSEEEGNSIYDAYFREFTGVQSYFEKVKKQALDRGYILFNDKVGSKSFIPNFESFLELKRKVTSAGFWTVYKSEKSSDSELYNNVLRPLVRTYFKRKGNIERRAINYPIQGSGAEMTKFACIDIFNQLKERGFLFMVHFSNVIHDEVLLEAPKKLAPTVAGIVAKSMEVAANYFCETIKFGTGKLAIQAELTTWWNH